MDAQANDNPGATTGKLTGRFALDFGTSNTILAVWDETRQQAASLHIPDFGHVYQQNGEPISVIPSLMHYAGDGRRWIGEQVITRGLYQSNQTLRWMKRYILNRSPIQVRAGEPDGQPRPGRARFSLQHPALRHPGTQLAR